MSKFKSGLKGNLPLSSDLNDFLYTTDTKELFIGNGVGMPKTRICTEVAINGDCVTDDSAIINAALVSLSASGGGTLKLPPGKTVAIASTIYLQSNVTLDLNRCILKWTGNTAGGVMISTHATVAPYYLLLKPGIGNGTLTPNSNVVTMIDLDDCWYLEMYDLHYNNANTNMTVISFAPGRNKPLFGVWNGVRFFDINNIIADYSIPAKYGVYFSGGYFPTGIASTTIGSSAGSGYSVNDVVNISGGVGGQFLITSVDVSGGVTGGSLYSYGSGYSAATDASVTGGTGTGLKLNTSIDIAATVTNGTFRNSNIVVSDTGYLFANNVDSVFMTGQHTANLVANNARGCVFNSVQNSNTFKAVNNIFFDHLVCWPDVTKTGCTAVTMGNSTAIYIYQLAKDPHQYWDNSNLIVDNYGTGYEINIADAGDGFGTQKILKGDLKLNKTGSGITFPDGTIQTSAPIDMGAIKSFSGSDVNWSGWGGYNIDPQYVKMYAGSVSAALGVASPILRSSATVSADSTTKSSNSYQWRTRLISSQRGGWANIASLVLDDAVGGGDHIGIQSHVHANSNRISGGSTTGNLWGFHGFVSNDGKDANGIGAELNVYNSDAGHSYLDDIPDGAGPNSTGHMMTALQLLPDGSPYNVTRGISIIGTTNTGFDTGITLTGFVNTGIYINAKNTITSTNRTDIKWGSATSITGLDMSAHTFTGPAIKLGENHSISDGTITKKLSEFAFTAGDKAPNRQVMFDSNGNLVSSSYDIGGASASGGVGTVSSGTTGQFAVYSSDGTAVAGHTLSSDDIITALGYTPIQTTGDVLTAGNLKPSSNSVSAVRITAADGLTSILTVDTINKYVGIGQFANTSVLSPLAPLHIANGSIWVEKYGTSPGIIGRFANGSITAPTQAKLNNDLFTVGCRPWLSDTSAFSLNTAYMTFCAAEDIDSTHKGTFIKFVTTPTGSATPFERFRIHASGGVTIGNALADPGKGSLTIEGGISASQLQVTSLATFSSNYFTHSSLSGWLRPTVAGLTIYGANAIPQIQDNAGTSNAVGSAYGLYARVDTGASYTGTVSNAYGISVGSPSKNNAGAVITTAYGIHCEDITAGVNNYAVYTTGTTKSYFGGNVGLGNTNPTEKLDVTGNIKATGSITGNSQYLQAANGVNTQCQLVAKDSGGTIVANYMFASNVLGTFSIYDAIAGNSPFLISGGSSATDTLLFDRVWPAAPAFTPSIVAIQPTLNTTITNAYGFYAKSPTYGSSANVTNWCGIRVDNQGSNKVFNSYGLRIVSQSGSNGTSFAIKTDGGLVSFTGNGVNIGGTTDPGANNLYVTGNATTKTVIETYVTLAASANTFTPNLSLGSTFGIPLGATNNIGTPINVPASGFVASMTLLLKQDNTGSRTISSWPSSFSWGETGVPALTTTPNKMDVITCFTVDGGASWTCFLSGRGF